MDGAALAGPPYFPWLPTRLLLCLPLDSGARMQSGKVAARVGLSVELFVSTSGPLCKEKLLTDCLPIKKVAEPNSNQMGLWFGSASQDVPRRDPGSFLPREPKAVQTHGSLRYLRAKKALSLLWGLGLWDFGLRRSESEALPPKLWPKQLASTGPSPP